MKTRASRRNYITKWLSIFIIVLALIVAAVSIWSFVNYRAAVDGVEKEAVAPDAMIAIDINASDLDVAVQEKLEDSLQRPLLFSTRRPIVAVAENTPEEEAAPEEKQPLDEQLVSVIITDTLRMVFLNGSDGVQRLEQGMSYKGWKLDQVNEDSAVFSQEDETTVLQLRTFANTSPVKPLRTLGDE